LTCGGGWEPDARRAPARTTPIIESEIAAEAAMTDNTLRATRFLLKIGGLLGLMR